MPKVESNLTNAHRVSFGFGQKITAKITKEQLQSSKIIDVVEPENWRENFNPDDLSTYPISARAMNAAYLRIKEKLA